MMLRVYRLQPRLRDMGINLRGRKAAVTEQHLHSAQVRAVIEQMRGESVA